MDFRKKKETARRIAKVELIPAYRSLLKARGSADADKIMLDKEALARSLVYNLLDFYTEAEIISSTSAPATDPSSSKNLVQGKLSRSTKKKIQNLKNTPQSHGGIWTILWSGLRTASTLIASTVTALWRRLKEILLRP